MIAFDRRTIGDRIYSHLRNTLISGELRPGEKLPLRDVAGSFGVSIMPVREAVIKLAAEGALEVQPNRAAKVPLLTLARFQEIIRARLVIEGMAAGEAAKLRSKVELEQIEHFRKVFSDEIRRSRPNARRAVRANMELHFAIYRASRSSTLLGIIESLWVKIGPVINLDLRSSVERLTNSGAERQHHLLVDAIRKRNVDNARSALVADISGSADYIVRSGSLPADQKTRTTADRK